MYEPHSKKIIYPENDKEKYDKCCKNLRLLTSCLSQLRTGINSLQSEVDRIEKIYAYEKSKTIQKRILLEIEELDADANFYQLIQDAGMFAQAVEEQITDAKLHLVQINCKKVLENRVRCQSNPTLSDSRTRGIASQRNPRIVENTLKLSGNCSFSSLKNGSGQCNIQNILCDLERSEEIGTKDVEITSFHSRDNDKRSALDVVTKSCEVDRRIASKESAVLTKSVVIPKNNGKVIPSMIAKVPEAKTSTVSHECTGDIDCGNVRNQKLTAESKCADVAGMHSPPARAKITPKNVVKCLSGNDHFPTEIPLLVTTLRTSTLSNSLSTNIFAPLRLPLRTYTTGHRHGLEDMDLH